MNPSLLNTSSQVDPAFLSFFPPSLKWLPDSTVAANFINYLTANFINEQQYNIVGPHTSNEDHAVNLHSIFRSVEKYLVSVLF